MLDFVAKFAQGVSYSDFLHSHGTQQQCRRWDDMHASVQLTDEQKSRLAAFRREMNVLCLAGTWCGDCVEQCPIFDHFARSTSVVQLRFFDRDEHSDLASELTICGGSRVPALVFLSEDGHEVSRFGDRTLAKYRHMAAQLSGPACPTGLVLPEQSLMAAVTNDWLDEFERAQLILRTSPRLRSKHGD